MTLGVVIPCYRQERFLPRTIAALERALGERDWRGVIVLATPAHDPLPALSARWSAITPPVSRPQTPGAARMLGLASVPGEWVLFVDADLEVDATWIEEGLDVAARGPRLAGVWGRVEEWFLDAGAERRGSADMFGVGRDERRVAYLTTPALYRRAALLEAGGYDPRLNSEEDFELGLRFRRLGLELRSLGRLAGRHWSAPRPSFGELGRRWRNGLCFGQGQVLRLYAGHPEFVTLLRRQALYLGMLAVWIAGLLASLAALVTADARPVLQWLVLPAAAVALMAIRKKSVRLGLHSVLSWSLLGFGLLVGLFRVPPGGRAPLAAGGGAC